MKNFYNKYFRTSEHQKINEKVFLVRMATAVGIIIICLTAMAFSAYAYFSSDISSSHNVIKSANFNPVVSIAPSVANSANDVTVERVSFDTHQATLQPNVKYTVTITKNADSSAKTGFCIITAERSDKNYHTQQIGIDGDTTVNVISFTLTIDATSATQVTFKSNWGTSSYYENYKIYGDNNPLYIIENDSVTITIPPPSFMSAPSVQTPVDKTPTQTTNKPADTTTAPTPETTVPDTTTSDDVPTDSPETTGNSTPETTQEPIQSTTVPSPDTTVPESTTSDSTGTESLETTGTTESETTKEPIDSTTVPTPETTPPDTTTSGNVSTESPETTGNNTPETTGEPSTSDNETSPENTSTPESD
ncbi:MAG: hypothetical protein E7574_01390 [Ruminococcaceae bacterium]|nr:hypothetical protein [Oscillospiraceae bacterium]